MRQNRATPTPRILWQDADFLIVSKPTGLLVDSGNRERDLLSEVGGHVFAFHRLDRATSGIVLLGKTRRFASEVTKIFEEKRIRKAYLAVVSGVWTASRIETPIENRVATTTFRRLAVATYQGAEASLVEALPKTGRTHQIRIHTAASGHAVLGDAKYGIQDMQHANDARVLGHALHAHRLDFRHPATGEVVVIRDAPLLWPSTWLASFNVEVLWRQLFAGDS